MKPIPTFYTSTIGCFALIVALISCTKKQSSDQPGDLTDLQGFPKEWVLVMDLAPPDSISRNYAILVDSSNSFLGSISIKQNGNDWQLTTSGFYYPGTYVVKNCKRVSEGEMVYYNLDLKNAQDTTELKLQVNFRHNPGQSDDIPSVFTCTTCDNHEDVLMAEKAVADKFQKKSRSSVQYD